MLLDLSDTISKPYDLFISHASEDKESFVRELATALEEKGLSIWYDEFTLTLGDPLRESIDKGLAESRFGIVVLSPAYFAKTWTKNELGGLFAIETAGKKVILPVWHNFSAQEMREKSPMLTDRIGVSSSQGVPYVVLKILEAIGKGVAPRIETLPRLGKLSGVPELPKKFLPRPGELAALKERLLAKEKHSVGLTGKSEKVGVHGMGGIGKSVLAAAAACDEEVRKAFPDGIVWVALGQQPQLTLRQQDVLERAGGEKREFKDAEQGKGVLEDFFREKSCLLIVDDIWDAQYAKLFNVVGPNGKLLITTRDKDVLLAIDAQEHSLDVLDDQRALEMLSLWSGEKKLPQEAIEVAKHCGGLPLALSVSGARVKEDGILWSDLLAALKETELEFLDHRQGNVLGAIESSVSVLKEKERYFDLAVFFEEAQIPEPTLISYWMHQAGLKERDSRALIGKLEKRALIRTQGEAPNRKIILHDLQQDYVRKRITNLSVLHGRLVDAYAKAFAGIWEAGKNDGYYFEHLPKHLKAAGRGDELRKLLLNFNWIDAKLEATDAATLVADYEVLEDDPVISLVKSALENSSHVLLKDKRQLPSQLVGRLLTRQEPEICDLLAQARTWQEDDWLEPLNPCLYQAGGELIRTLQGHASSVTWVAFSPDGKQIFSGSVDHTLKIWDRESGEEVCTLQGQARFVSAVAFSPDGKQILYGSRDNTLKILNRESGKEVRTLQGHVDRVNLVAFSPDGKQILSGSWDNTVKIWDRESGKEVYILQGHEDLVTSVAFSPDGKQILSGSYDKTLKIWDRETGKEMRTLQGAEMVTSVAFSPDGQHILSGSYDKTVKIWDRETGKEVRTLHGHANLVTSVAFSPDGQHILSGSGDHTAKIWDQKSGKEVRTLQGHAASVNSVAFSPDGQQILSGSEDQSVKIWDRESGKEAHTLQGHAASVNSLAFSPDGKEILSGSDDWTVKIWERESGKEAHTLQGHAASVNSLAFSPDGKEILSGSDDWTVNIWERESGKEARTLQGHMSPVTSVGFSPDGKQILSGSRDQTVKIWDRESGKEVRTLQGHADSVTSVAFSPNGQQILSGAQDKTMKIWDRESGEKLRTLKGHAGSVNSVTFSPDGQQILSGSNDNTLNIWDSKTGKGVRTFRGHSNKVNSVAFSPDGKQILSGSWDKTVKIWDRESGKEVVTFVADAAITCCAMERDLIIAGDNRGQIYRLRLHLKHSSTSA